MLLEILEKVANWGFPAFFCVLWYFDLRKKTISLDKTSGFLDKTVGSLVIKVDSLEKVISNDLVHALEKNTEITKENSDSSDKVEVAIIKMTTSVDGMCNKLTELIEKK